MMPALTALVDGGMCNACRTAEPTIESLVESPPADAQSRRQVVQGDARYPG
jgi:hypothetical protein